jgi:hypothetical protein
MRASHWILGLLVFAGVQAHAGLISFQATSLLPALATNFNVIYDDTGDGLLQVGEILTFSGVTFTGVAPALDGFYYQIVAVPNIAGLASGTGGGGGGGWDMRRLSDGAVFSPTVNAWSYAATPVPEPGALSLLAVGLLALGYLRHRRVAR